MNLTTLIIPGIGNSDPEHWQSLWEISNPSFIRIHHRDWDHPVCEEWVMTLEGSVSSIGDHAILVAHSLGCLLVAQWAKKTQQNIKGALLVAPPDPDGGNFPRTAIGFSPLPGLQLSFPSIVVASSDDPYADIDFAKSLAASWGSRFVNIGQAGHISSNSGLGEWSKGFEYFLQLVGHSD